MYQHFVLFGHSISTYDFFNSFAVVGQIIVTIFVARQFRAASTLPALINLRFNKKAKDSFFWRWSDTIVLILVVAGAMYLVNELTGDSISLLTLHTRDDNFFPNIFVGPLTAFTVSLLILNSPLKTMDVITPVAEIALVFYKIACFCWGCCYGVEWNGGLYNQRNERYEFPVQLVEVACAIIMFIILMLLLKKKKQHDGMLYPLFMLMYCGSRFVSEFWRDDYPAVFGRLTGYHLSCIVGFAEGAILMVVVLLWGERITNFFEGKTNAILQKSEKKHKKTFLLLRKSQNRVWESLFEKER